MYNNILFIANVSRHYLKVKASFAYFPAKCFKELLTNDSRNI